MRRWNVKLEWRAVSSRASAVDSPENGRIYSEELLAFQK